MKLRVRLAAEADDEIAGDRGVRHRLRDLGEHLAVRLDRVAALHPPQHGVAAALGRNVQIGRDLRQIAHRLQEIGRHVLGVIRDELQPADALDLVQLVEQVGQANRLRAGRVFVAVDGLAEQCDFQAAVVGQMADLFDNFGGRAALLRPAHPRHDAIGAELIAAERHPHHRLRKGVRTIFPKNSSDPFSPFSQREAGETLFDRRSTARIAVEADFHPLSAAGSHVFEQGWQLAQLPWADHQIDVRGAAEDLLLILLGHAAQHADDRVRIPLLDLFQPAQGAVNLILGMLPHAARVQQNHVGPADAIDQFMARAQQVGRDQLAIEHVHLAANSLDIASARHRSHCSRGGGPTARGKRAGERAGLR